MARLIKEISHLETDEQGNVKSFKQIQEKYIPNEEPNFIKLYLDHILVHTDLSVKLSPILIEVCQLANYADNKQGGMMVFLNSYTKEQIRTNLNYTSIKMVEKSITSLVKSKILIRKGRGAYLLNPYYFGKGHWADIKKIRATIDFNTGEFIPELKFNVRDSGGNILEEFYEDEHGNVININTGEVVKEKIMQNI